MSWKIVTDSDRCDYKSVSGICHHKDNYNEQHNEEDCPIKKRGFII